MSRIICANCCTRSSYNTIGSILPKYCTKHKDESMVRIIMGECRANGCVISPSYNMPNEVIPIFCSKHKNSIMIDVKHKVCKTNLCGIQVRNPNYDGYCFRCFVYTHPNEYNYRNYKTKEIYVRDYILTKFSQYTWICDKKITDGCSNRRPDILLDLGDKVLIIEVDENQHNNYDNICELVRITNISDDLNNRPIVLIRFNPDNYTDKYNTIIKSPWKINKNGYCVIHNQNEIDNRLTVLSNKIKYIVKSTYTDLLTIYKLFYNIFSINLKYKLSINYCYVVE
jgi:hypothetical protein